MSCNTSNCTPSREGCVCSSHTCVVSLLFCSDLLVAAAARACFLYAIHFYELTETSIPAANSSSTMISKLKLQCSSTLVRNCCSALRTL